MPLLFDSGPSIRPEEFRPLRELINRYCGIVFHDDASLIVERRLKERLRKLGLTDYGQYYQYLRFNPDGAAELERAIDLLTTNETYFFREDYQLRAFQRELLPELWERGKHRKRLNIWSAGCSTGEELYTLAILISESGLFDSWEVRCFGSDISRRVLQTARRGTYGTGSFRSMPSEYNCYFTETPDGRQVVPHVRAMCHFGHLNLLNGDRAAVLGQVDVIFCRNVLIYFDTLSRKRVIDIFYDRLSPGGYLLLGHSESLLNLSTSFELVHLRGELVYRKPQTASELAEPPKPQALGAKTGSRR